MIRRQNAFSNADLLDEPFEYQGMKWKTVEHWYSAMKLRKEDVEGRRAIAELVSPYAAKQACRTAKLAREGRLRPDWCDALRIAIMEFALRTKFAPGTSWHRKLMATRGPLVEWSRWGDVFWSMDVSTGVGHNHLGPLLTGLRDQYRLASVVAIRRRGAA